MTRRRTGLLVLMSLIAILALAGPVAAVAPARDDPMARVSKSCGMVHGRVDGYPGGKTRIHAAVYVKRGKVRCRTARWIGRMIITGKGECHSGDPGYCIVGNDQWLGGTETGGWSAFDLKHPGRVIGGRAWGAIDG